LAVRIAPRTTATGSSAGSARGNRKRHGRLFVAFRGFRLHLLFGLAFPLPPPRYAATRSGLWKYLANRPVPGSEGQEPTHVPLMRRSAGPIAFEKAALVCRAPIRCSFALNGPARLFALFLGACRDDMLHERARSCNPSFAKPDRGLTRQRGSPSRARGRPPPIAPTLISRLGAVVVCIAPSGSGIIMPGAVRKRGDERSAPVDGEAFLTCVSLSRSEARPPETINHLGSSQSAVRSVP